MAIVLIGTALRAYYLRQPMRYDESVTYLYFVSQSWATVLGSYTYPNNHVLHSVLAKACTTVLGDAPWVLRLPAFVAGVAMIPATYAVGRRAFGSTAAHVAAALVASSGALALYSTNARGYTMVALATLLLADLLLRLRAQPSAAAWSGVALTIALGMWTIPVMLFPAGGLALWFLLSALRGDTSERRADLARLGLALLVATVLTVALYSPILANDGPSALVSNAFVRSSVWRVFFRQLAGSVRPVLSAWSLGYPLALAVVVGGLAVVGLIVTRLTAARRVSMTGSMYVWCALVLLVTHRVPFFRVWLFLIAPIALLAAHGTIASTSRVAARVSRLTVNDHALGLTIAAALALVVLVNRGVETSHDTGTLPDAERITRALSTALRPGDRVVAPIPSNGPLAYYFVRAGVDTAYLSAVPGDSSRTYLVVNTGEGFTLNTRLNDPILNRLSKARLVARFSAAELYQMY